MDFSNSNLYQLFFSLNPEELRELGKALNSPYFNHRQEEIRLYQYLMKVRKTKAVAITASEACAYVLPDRPADQARLRHVMSHLVGIITRYLTIREMEQSGEQKELLLTRSLRRRNLNKLFLSQYQSARQYMDTEAMLSPDLYYHQFQVYTEYYTYSISQRQAQHEELQQLDGDLDTFYLIQKLKHACNALSYQNIFKYEHDAAPIEKLMQLVGEKIISTNPLAELLYANYHCLREPQDEAHFIRLKALLLTRSERIAPREMKDIFTLAINYCIRRLNSGARDYYTEVFELYEAGLTRGVFEEDNKLSPFTYKNITAISLGLKKYDWTATFIEQYRSKLDAEVREGFYAYCMARYHFALGHYDQVGDLLRQADIREQFTDLDARVLLIKTYYELDEATLLDYAIDNLKQQLKRKNLQTYHQTLYGHFARLLSQVINLRPYDKKARQTLKEKIIQTKALAERDWLLSKV